MKLSEETKKIIKELQTRYPEKRSALIPALHLAQNETGYLPQEIQVEVAALFNLAPNEIKSVVSFYDMFFEEPKGKNIIHVCKNLSCMLRGSDEILGRLCQKLNIAPGETTTDGQFSVIPSECLGACDRAPMMLVNETVVGPVKQEDLGQILSEAAHA